MAEQLADVTLQTVCGGRAVKVFEYEYARVMENIRDPNMKATAKRSIQLTIEITPHKSRNEASVQVKSKTTLADVEPQDGHIFMSHKTDRTVSRVHDTRQEEVDLTTEKAATQPQPEE